ncbi:tetraspanin-32-like isoform X2 [Cetorhinus maximus]
MRIGCLIKATKYQLLGTSFTVMFLGVAVAAITLWISFSDEFIVIRNITIETNRYARLHDLAAYSGLSASVFLTLLGIICLIGIIRESEYLLSVVLFCFALLFCGVVQMMYWRSTYKQLFLCCGKNSTFSHYNPVENETCFAEGPPLKDCLQAVEDQITGLMAIVEALMVLLGIVTVYGMILAAFLCFAGCLTVSWYTKGKYKVAKQ